MIKNEYQTPETDVIMIQAPAVICVSDNALRAGSTETIEEDTFNWN